MHAVILCTYIRVCRQLSHAGYYELQKLREGAAKKTIQALGTVGSP